MAIRGTAKFFRDVSDTRWMKLPASVRPGAMTMDAMLIGALLMIGGEGWCTWRCSEAGAISRALFRGRGGRRYR